MATAGHDRFVGATLQETLMGLVLSQTALRGAQLHKELRQGEHDD